MNTNRSRRAGRRIGRMVMGLVLIGAGLYMIANASMVASRLSAYVSPPPDPTAGLAGSGTSEGYFPYFVWGLGFTLIGSGGAILRGAFMSPLAGAGGMMAGGVDSAEMMNAYMQQAMSSMPRTQAPTGSAGPSEVVRIKCRNCGSLEAEDATFCRKCGQPL